MPRADVRNAGAEPAEPTATSRTSRVPARVPSVRQSSVPCTPSVAEKYTTPSMRVSPSGSELAVPSRMSSIIAVPDGVPSDRHSSLPWTPSVAANSTPPGTATRLDGDDPRGIRLRSRIIAGEGAAVGVGAACADMGVRTISSVATSAVASRRAPERRVIL